MLCYRGFRSPPSEMIPCWVVEPVQGEPDLYALRYYCFTAFGAYVVEDREIITFAPSPMEVSNFLSLLEKKVHEADPCAGKIYFHESLINFQMEMDNI